VGGMKTKSIVVGTIGTLLLSMFLMPLELPALDFPTCEDHLPVFIDGNEDLITTASNEDWSGTGSIGSPIRISNLKISSEHIGIHIVNVTFHFIIENCLIEPYVSETGPVFGILIENCEHVSIERCVIVGHYYGIYIRTTDDVYVSRTEIMDGTYGVFLNDTSNVWLHSLDVIVCENGIGLNHSLYTFIDQTIIDYPTNSGIECINSFGTIMRQNCLYGPEQGIVLIASSEWTIEESVVFECEFGIDVIDTVNGYVLDSIVMNCTDTGIWLHESTNNVSVVFCSFGPTNSTNARDDGEGNYWCLNETQDGNYWSDWDSEGPYLIPGTAESLDLYPTLLVGIPDWQDLLPRETTSGNSTTPTDDIGLGPVIGVSAAAIVGVVLIAVVMVRSRVSPGVS
jgi:hypothetical protein